MTEFLVHIFLAIALIFVIEGLIYAVFTTQIQKVMKLASEMDPEKFRYYGASMVALGVMGIWLIQKFL